MTTAISLAAEHGAKAVICASTGNTCASAAAYATKAGMTCARARARRQDRDGQAQPGDRARRHAAAGRRQLRRLPDPGPQARRGLPGRAGQLGQPGPDRGPEDRGLRGRRRPRRRPRHPLPPGRQRRQHHGLLEGLPRVPPRQRAARPGDDGCPQMWGFQAAGAAPDRPGPPRRRARHHRHRDPHRQPRLVEAGRGGPRRVRRPDRVRHRRADPAPPTGCSRPARASSSSPARPPGRRPAAGRRGRARARPAPRIVCTVTGHGLKDPQWALKNADGVRRRPDPGPRRRVHGGPGPGAARADGRGPDARQLRSQVRVPASSANLGPGLRLRRACPRALGHLRRHRHRRARPAHRRRG